MISSLQPSQNHYLKNYSNLIMIHQLSRLLQMLGAFGLLTKRKGKPQFADYIHNGHKVTF